MRVGSSAEFENMLSQAQSAARKAVENRDGRQAELARVSFEKAIGIADGQGDWDGAIKAEIMLTTFEAEWEEALKKRPDTVTPLLLKLGLMAFLLTR